MMIRILLSMTLAAAAIGCKPRNSKLLIDDAKYPIIFEIIEFEAWQGLEGDEVEVSFKVWMGPDFQRDETVAPKETPLLQWPPGKPWVGIKQKTVQKLNLKVIAPDSCTDRCVAFVLFNEHDDYTGTDYLASIQPYVDRYKLPIYTDDEAARLIPPEVLYPRSHERTIYHQGATIKYRFYRRYIE